MGMERIARGVIAGLQGLLGVLTVLFAWAYWERYARWTFNEEGRYYDPVDQVVYTTSGFVWILLAGCTFMMVLLLEAFWRWRRRTGVGQRSPPRAGRSSREGLD